MNKRVLSGLAIAVLLSSTSARAGEPEGEDFAGSVGMGAGPTGFDFRMNVHDGTQKQTNMQMNASAHEEFSSSKPGESFKLTYDSNKRKTVFKVVAPEGLGLRVSESGQIVLEDSIPVSFDAIGGKFYRFEVFTPKAVVFDKKFEAKPGMLAVLSVVANGPVVNANGAGSNTTINVNSGGGAMPPPPPPAPAPAPTSPCMKKGDYNSISGEIEEESFGDEKLNVLRDAMKDRVVCVQQVINFLDLFTFSQEKLTALKIMAPRITDTENNYKIYGAFEFSNDKAEAKKILK